MKAHSAMLSKCALPFLLALLGSGTALSQAPAWPTRPITIIVPQTQGSAGDIYARLYSQVLGENMGWKILVDYKPGAGTTLGAAYVAKAAPDGYTTLAISSSLTTAPFSYKNLSFDPAKSFDPISLLARPVPSYLLVYPGMPVNNFKEYVAYAKANPGRISFGLSGLGSSTHLNSVWLHHVLGVEVTYVPYKGAGDVANALQAGQIQASLGGGTNSLAIVKSGKARVLAVTPARRTLTLPDMPTLQELGVPDFDHQAWTGLFAPAGTPLAIRTLFSREIVRASEHPTVIKLIASTSGEKGGGGSTPEVVAQIVQKETDKWRRLVQETKLQIDPE